jgi:hypothetical protein
MANISISDRLLNKTGTYELEILYKIIMGDSFPTETFQGSDDELRKQLMDCIMAGKKYNPRMPKDAKQ